MSAAISTCGRYRYELRRALGVSGRGTVVWIMCNPSIANALDDDATIRKVVGFSRRWEFAQAVVVNLYGLRARDVKELGRVRDPVGVLNDRYVGEACAQAERVIVAWGRYDKMPDDALVRVEAVQRLVGVGAWMLGVNGDGSPAHPLMLGYNTELRRWS